MSARARREPGRGQDHDWLWTATHTPVAALMSRDVVCVPVDLGIEELSALFVDRGLHGAPVVNELGEPIGFVSARDVLRHTHDCGDTEETRAPLYGDLRSGFHIHDVPRATVADVMTPAVVTVNEAMSITAAAAVMTFERVHRAPVVSRRGKVVGMFSALDVLRWLAGADGYRTRAGA